MSGGEQGMRSPGAGSRKSSNRPCPHICFAGAVKPSLKNNEQTQMLPNGVSLVRSLHQFFLRYSLLVNLLAGNAALNRSKSIGHELPKRISTESFLIKDLAILRSIGLRSVLFFSPAFAYCCTESGSNQLEHFSHILKPGFIEAGLLLDSAISAAVSAIDSQIASLAPVLNGPTNTPTVSSPVRIDKTSGYTYVFAVSPATATFIVPGVTSGTATVINENRRLTTANGSFLDGFGAYAVHLHTVGGSSAGSTKFSINDRVQVSSELFNIRIAQSTGGRLVASQTGTKYSDTSLAASAVYSYRAKAKDAAGKISAASLVVSSTQAGSPSTGWPDASSTGVPAGTSLTIVNSDVNITVAGTIYENRDVRGCITVNAPNVIIRKSKVSCPGGAISSLSTNLLVEDVTIECQSKVQTAAIGADNYTARRVNVSKCENLLWAGDNVTIEDSYLHDPIPYDPETDPHVDGIQMYFGSNVTMRHNRIYAGNKSNVANSAIITQYASNVTIDNNLLAGGGYTVYCNDKGSGVLRVTNNHFSTIFFPKVGLYGPWLNCKNQSQVTGNVYHETGQLLPGQQTGGPTDTIPPSVPTGLTATAVSSSQINLRWNASTDNVGVTGYKIFRGGTQIATVTGTTYSDTELSASTAYDYRVAAYDAARHTSAQSAVASASTPAGTAAPRRMRSR